MASVSRKQVVILFVDLVGFTPLAERLDPEPLQALMDRYYRACTAAIAEHGGVVEKFIGDAIMAVFGMPLAHEDDAMRGVRAAIGAVGAVHELGAEVASTHGVGLDVHCGLCSGEVIATATPTGDLRVVGDAVNTASRLQSAAQPGEILVGRSVAQVVRTYVELAAVAPLTLKGKAEPVPAWRVGALRPDPEPRIGGSLVGRDEELDQLRHALRRTVRGRECCLVTVLGAPGLGKSRLVREFVANHHGEPVHVLTGHCRSYGSGNTYRPIADMLDSYPGGWPAVRSALAGGDGTGQAVKCLAAIGPGAATDRSPGGVEEFAWAVRTLFETLAAQQPLIVVCDDLQWAEPTLLDLLDDVATSLVGLPVLLVCLARPELLEARPTWGGGRSCAMTMELTPLLPDQIELLLHQLVGDAEVLAHSIDSGLSRVAESSGGNPLYATLMFDMLVDGDDLAVPPTVHALLGALIDRLPPVERGVISRAATIGREFTGDRVAALYDADGPRPGDLRTALLRLQRRRLLEGIRAPGRYRFAQALTRDVAYAMTAKVLRRDWHLRTADRLVAERPAREQIRDSNAMAQQELAYHLEAACVLGRELDPADPGHRTIAIRAAGELAILGTQALGQKDLPAAAGLLGRACRLMPVDRPEHRALAIRLSDAWLAMGVRDKAIGVLDESAAAFTRDERGRSILEIQRELLAVRFGTTAVAELPARCDRLATGLAADPDNHLGWCRLHQLRALSWLVAGRVGAAELAMRDSITHARAMGDRHEEQRLLIGRCELAQWSPEPVDVGLDLCATLTERLANDRALLVPVLSTQARLLALRGDLAEARTLLADALRHADDLHLTLARIAVAQTGGLVESLAGDHAQAARLFGTAGAELRAAGQPLPAVTLELYAARERFRAGAPVDETLRTLPHTGTGSELRAQLTGAVLRAHLLALAGNADEARRLVDTAGPLIDATDDPCLQADTLFELALAWTALGHSSRAEETAAQALRRYTGRGAALPAGRVAGWLATNRAA